MVRTDHTASGRGADTIRVGSIKGRRWSGRRLGRWYDRLRADGVGPQIYKLGAAVARAASPPWQRLGMLTGFAILALFTVMAAGSATAAGSLEEGRRLAKEHCSRCHVVEDNKFGGIGSTPSFRLLVTAFKDWRTRFETFYARRPHPAFVSIEGKGRLREDLPPNAHPVTLPARAIDDLVALAEHLNGTEKPLPSRAIEGLP